VGKMFCPIYPASGSTDAPGMRQPTALRPGLIPAPMKGAVLLLAEPGVPGRDSLRKVVAPVGGDGAAGGYLRPVTCDSIRRSPGRLLMGRIRARTPLGTHRSQLFCDQGAVIRGGDPAMRCVYCCAGESAPKNVRGQSCAATCWAAAWQRKRHDEMASLEASSPGR
jgi:hypothetical protein